jgi:hypothetical protein
LINWRNRYSKIEYPEKVVINIFYRKVTMEILFNAFLNSFEIQEVSELRFKWDNYEEGFRFFSNAYSKTAIEKTQNILPIILKDRADAFFGNIKYETFNPLIKKAAQGDSKELENIEFNYLYYFLTDQSILFWSALGGTGLSKIDAIYKMTGVLIETPVNNYAQIEEVLGKFFVAPYLKFVTYLNT